MANKSMVMGNLVVLQWYDEVTVADVDEAFKTVGDAYRLSGPMSGISLLGPKLQRPRKEVLTRMYELHPQMRTFLVSSHYLLLVGGLLATSIMAIVTQLFTAGTGGDLYFHTNVKDAVRKAGECQRLTFEAEFILRELERRKIP